MNYQARITSKGQVTLPVGLRKQLNLKTGDELSFVETEDGSFRLLPHPPQFKDLRGIVQIEGERPTLFDIENAREKARRNLGEKYLRFVEPAE